jgi:MFS family permease
VRLNSPAFRQSRPVLLTTFTNKVGSIGLSLVPILLVHRGVSTAEGAMVLTSLKSMILAGTLIGGALSDRLRSRTLVLAALLMSAFGLGLLPFQKTLWLILFCGIIAQLGESLMNVVQRILLMDRVDSVHQKEALGWLRMVNNFAQIFSYGIAAAASSLGVAPLMIFDSVTSLGAFFVGRKLLPSTMDSRETTEHGLSGGEIGGAASKTAFFSFAVVLMGWALFYELFLEGGAGRLEMLHPGEGLRRFSTMMIFNTILCSAFAVHASRFFQKSWTAITGGLALTAVGILVAVWGMSSQGWVLAGMLLITLGEIMLGALAQYTLMRLTPSKKNAGFYYSLGLTLMQGGRIAGAALAFPLLIHAKNLHAFTFLIACALLVLLAILAVMKETVSRLG